MANPDIDEIITTTIASRRKKLADNVTNNTSLLTRLKQKSKMNMISGGHSIYEELEYNENRTYKRYTGYEYLDIRPSDVFTAADFDIRQAAVAVIISGLEQLKNAGKEQMINLLQKRIGNAEKTMVNGLSNDLYSDGTADGGKQVDGLQAAVTTSPTTGTYGDINAANYEFWRNQHKNTAVTSDNIKDVMIEMWTELCRNSDKPDLIAADNKYYRVYWAALQDQQRFTNPAVGRMGFSNLKFDSADVILDGGVNGSAPDDAMFFLNTDYIYWRPHRDANMTPSTDRFPINQDAMARLIFWAGNLTCSNRSLQGRLSGTVS